MTIEEIYNKVNSIEGLEGMTVNERLYACGLMDLFEQMRENNQIFAKEILQAIRVDEYSIQKILNLK